MQTAIESGQLTGTHGARGEGVSMNPHRSSRRPAPSDASRRAEVQQHLDARTARLQAYVTSLEVALESRHSGEQAVQLERRLAQGRRDLQASAQPRMPARVLLSKAHTPKGVTQPADGAAAS